MKIKTLLLASAAAGALVLAAPFAATIPLATPAQAAVNVGVSINVGTFYDRLSPYGDWVSLNGRDVWVPEQQPANWQPYTRGHWAYTRRYGWMWVSAEPFGWATYHYGRWGHADTIGWYWVPGYRWAPAWVSWRRSDSYVAWAPLPVGSPDEINASVTIGKVPDFYWQVVPTQSFLSVNLFGVVIHDRHRADNYLRDARPVGGVRIENNVIVNNVIDVKFVEQRTHKKVRTYKVQEDKTPGKAAKVEGDSIQVFAPQVKKGGDHKPKQVKSVEEVQAKHKKDVGTSQQSSDQQTQTGDQQTQTGDQTGNKKQDKAQKTTTQQPQAADQSGNKKKKKQDKAQKTTTQQPQAADQSGNKKKQDKAEKAASQQPQAADQSGKKKKKLDKAQKKATQQPQASDLSGNKKKLDKVQKTTNHQPKAADQSGKKKKLDKAQKKATQQPQAVGMTDKKKKKPEQQQPVVQ